MPFRAAIACETYARPRPPVSSSKRAARSLRQLVAARRRLTPGPSTGTSRPAEKRAHHLVVVVVERRRGRRARASAPGAGSTRRGPGAPVPARCRARRRAFGGRRGRRRARRPADRSDRARASAARAAAPAADARRTSDSTSATSSESTSTLEVGGDPVLEHAQVEILEPVDLGLREVLELRVCERRAAPERERLAQEPSRARAALACAPLVRAARNGRGRADRRRARAGSPAGRVCRSPGPSSLRSWETVFWSEVVAVRGGCSPQSSLTRRSEETGSFARSNNSVKRARWFRPPSGTGVSPSRTSRGPRIRNSSTCCWL